MGPARDALREGALERAEPLGRPLMESAAVRARTTRRAGPRRWVWPGAAAAFLASLLVGALVGPTRLGVGDVLASLLAHAGVPGMHPHLTATEETILWQIRLP